jgi:hypothetical protein
MLAKTIETNILDGDRPSPPRSSVRVKEGINRTQYQSAPRSALPDVFAEALLIQAEYRDG